MKFDQWKMKPFHFTVLVCDCISSPFKGGEKTSISTYQRRQTPVAICLTRCCNLPHQSWQSRVFDNCYGCLAIPVFFALTLVTHHGHQISYTEPFLLQPTFMSEVTHFAAVVTLDVSERTHWSPLASHCWCCFLELTLTRNSPFVG